MAEFFDEYVYDNIFAIFIIVVILVLLLLLKIIDRKSF